MKLLFVLLILVSCGKKESSKSPQPPCSGSQLVGNWSLSDTGGYAKTDIYCSYIEHDPRVPEYYRGTFVDHNKGQTRGRFTITLTDGTTRTFGYTIIIDSYGNKELVYEY